MLTSPLRREALIAAAYATMAAVATFPLVLHMDRAIAGDGQDAWQFYWNLWWVTRAITDLHASPYFSPVLYFPYGASLYFDTLNVLPSVLAIPLVLAAGLPLAYNSLVLAAFTASGYGMYRLALYVLRQEEAPAGVAASDGARRAMRLAAILAGCTFTFSSYHFAHLLGHLDLVCTQTLPFAVLFQLKTARERTWRNPILCAGFLAATALTSWYYLVYLLVFAVVTICDVALREGRARWRAIARIAMAVVLFAFIVSPVAVPMLALGRTAGRVPNPQYDVDRFSTDLVAFAVPSFLHPLWGSALAPTYRVIARGAGGVEAIAFLGYVPLLLAGVGVAGRWRARWFWVAAFALFSALALGPVLHIGGRTVHGLSWLMPYRLVGYLPYGDIPRVPARFVVMGTLCLSVLAARGAWILQRALSPRPAAFVAGILCALGIAETLPVPFPTRLVDVPPFYTRLRAESGNSGVLELPIPDDPATYPRRMLYQTVHGKPVYGGYVSRSLPPVSFDAIPGFSQFKTLSSNIDDVVRYDTQQLPALSRTALAAYRVGWVVIEKEWMNAERLSRASQIADALLGPSARLYEDSSTLAYAVPAYMLSADAATWLDVGWSYLEHPDTAASPQVHWRWMATSARIAITVSAPTTIRLRMVASAFVRARQVNITLGDRTLATLVVPTERAEFTTEEFSVPSGTSFITLESLDSAASAMASGDPRRLSVAVYELESIVNRQR